MTHDTEAAALRGDFHFPLSRAALCAEHECSEVFALPVRSSSDGAHRCPACGGAQIIMLEAALSMGAERRSMMEQIVRTVKEAIALYEEMP